MDRLPAEGETALLLPSERFAQQSPSVATFSRGHWCEDSTGHMIQPTWIGSWVPIAQAKAAPQMAAALMAFDDLPTEGKQLPKGYLAARDLARAALRSAGLD
jgi:hypothetical protein